MLYRVHITTPVLLARLASVTGSQTLASQPPLLAGSRSDLCQRRDYHDVGLRWPFPDSPWLMCEGSLRCLLKLELLGRLHLFFPGTIERALALIAVPAPHIRVSLSFGQQVRLCPVGLPIFQSSPPLAVNRPEVTSIVALTVSPNNPCTCPNVTPAAQGRSGRRPVWECPVDRPWRSSYRNEYSNFHLESCRRSLCRRNHHHSRAW